MGVPAIDQAIIAHRAWVSRLRMVLLGYTTEPICSTLAGDFENCVLGRFLTELSSAGQDDLLESLDQTHRRFHQVAEQAAEQFLRQGPSLEILEQVDEMSRLSVQLVRMLLKVKVEVSHATC